MTKKNIAIIGLGLIGGSFGLVLKKKKMVKNIFGFDTKEENQKIALKRKIVDKIMTFEEVIAKSDIIILAIPANKMHSVSLKVLDRITDQTVIEVGSIKQPLAQKIEKHPKRKNYILTHPMWGTENSGPLAALDNAFINKNVVICDKEKSDKKHLSLIQEMYKSIGMNILYMNSEEHDLHAAYVSHISHITSFALSLAVLNKEKDDNKIFQLASGGFESTVRLAKSSSTMWTPIFIQNKKNILSVLKENIHMLDEFMKAIEKEDTRKVNQLILRANKIRKILDK